MNGENGVEPINILTSRDELLFVLKALEADFIPGLDLDPMGELTAEQQSLALAVAGRGLRARELARAQPDGELQIHTTLLTIVGVCAYAQNVAFVYHWPADTAAPQRYFAHIRGDDIVVHMLPEESLHLFSLLPDKGMLLDQILAACHWRDTSGSTAHQCLLPGTAFATAREMAAAGNLDEARQALSESDAGPEVLELLLETLVTAPAVSILQTIKQPGDGTIQKRDITLLQSEQQSWLLIAPENGADGPLQVKTSSSTELRELLDAWL